MKAYGRRLICGMVACGIAAGAGAGVWLVMRLCKWLYGLIPNKQLDLYSVAVTLILCSIISALAAVIEAFWQKKKGNVRRKGKKDRAEDEDE